MEPLITPSTKKECLEDLTRLKTLGEAAPAEGGAAQASGRR
jgi:hypothetical protein